MVAVAVAVLGRRRDIVFTVKLLKGEAVKLVAGASVEIAPKLGGGREIILTDSAGVITRYEVSLNNGEAYSLAYVENSHGKTTQVVRP